MDRLYLNGYVPLLATPGGLVTFIRQHLGKPIPSPVVLGRITADFRERVRTFAETNDIPIVPFSHGERKDDTANRLRRERGVSNGVVFIGVAQEKARTFSGKPMPDHPGCWLSRYPVTVFRIAPPCRFPDAASPPMVAPAPGRVKALRCAPIPLRGTPLAAFTHPRPGAGRSCGDGGRVALAPGCLTPIRRRRSRNISRANTPSAPRGRSVERPGRSVERPGRSGWCPAQPAHRVPQHRPEAVLQGRPRAANRDHVPRSGRLHPQQGLSNFAYLQQLGRHINQLAGATGGGRGLWRGPDGPRSNRRLLEVERVSQNSGLSADSIQRVVQPTVTDDGQEAPGLRFGDPRVMALVLALTVFTHLLHGFRNHDLRALVTDLPGPASGPYRATQASYDLRRLCRKGIV